MKNTTNIVTSRTLSLLLLTTIALLIPHKHFVLSQQCTICDDGSAPNGTFGGTDCALIEDIVGMTPESDEECAMTRLEGFRYCACPSFPSVYCSMCNYPEEADAYELLSKNMLDQTIPTLDNATCREAEFLSIEDDRCAILSNAAWFCGCPSNSINNVVRGDCYLCDDQRTPNQRKLPPLFQKTCDQVDREGGLYFADQELCQELLLGETANQVSVEDYCDCIDDTTPIDSCTFCEDDGEILNPDGIVYPASGAMVTPLSCSELYTLTRYVVDDNYCSTLKADHAFFCCNPEMPTTATPTTQAPMTVPTENPPSADTLATMTPTKTPPTTSMATNVASGAVFGLTMILTVEPIFFS